MRRMHSSQWLFAFLWAIWIISPTWLNPVLAVEVISTTHQVPSWQSGVSTFNGSGYDLPTDPVSSATIAKSTSTTTAVDTAPARPPATPYTVPTVPGSSYPAFNNFGATDPVAQVANYDYGAPSLNGPTIESPVIAYPSADQPAANDLTLPAPIGSGASDPISDQISTQLNAAADSEPAPLQQEVVQWYQYPSRWMKGWDSHAEFGLDGSDGNAETLAIQTGLEMKRKADAYTFALDFDYRQASSRGVTTEDNGRVNLDYDRLLGDSDWSAFGKLGLEWDKFKAFDLRLNLNGGLGYHWVRTKKASLVTRFGAGASKEFGSPDDDWTPEGVFGIEAERQLTSRQKIKGKFDYFPAWENANDYRTRWQRKPKPKTSCNRSVRQHAARR